MDILTFITVLIIQSLLTDYSGSVIINGSKLRSFTCLGMNATGENCRVLSTAAPIPDRLQNIYRNHEMKVQNALDTGELQKLSERDLASLHPDLLLLIPSSELANIEGEKLAFLIDHWSGDKAIIKHILKAVLQNDNKNKFLHRTRSINFENDALDTMGEVFSLKTNPKLLGPLLAHLPFYELFNVTKEKRDKLLLFLKPYLNKKEFEWNKKRPIIHRAWSKIAIEEELSRPISILNNLQIETLGKLLLGAKPSELSQIEGKKWVDKTRLMNFDFNILQIRVLFTKIYGKVELTSLDFRDLKPILVRLLPIQIQRFSNLNTSFRHLQVFPPVKSIATSKQIIEFLLREGQHQIPRRSNDNRDHIFHIGRMIHALPLFTLSMYRNKPLSLDQLLPLQSKYLTPSQVYYLLGTGSMLLSLSDQRIKEATVYLHALPTSQLHEELDQSLVAHLSLHLPNDNLPRLMKFLYHSLPTIVSIDVMMKMLQTPDRLKIFDYLPSRLLLEEMKNKPDVMKKMSNELISVLPQLPKRMVTLLYRSSSKYFSNSDFGMESTVEIFNGISCDELWKLSTSDFIPAISRFRSLIKLSNQEFPKELQHCTARKLAEYLKLKSFFRQQFVGDTLLSLLSPVEIEAVGGWVLSSLPLGEIITSHMEDIVRQIGSMSATEILAAAPIKKMRAITYNYLALQEPMAVIGAKELSFLGNLTMLLEEDVIRNIDVGAFKELLEGCYFDTRICSTLTQRKAWQKLINRAFGPTSKWSGEELTILKNLLIVITEEQLNDIPRLAWMQIADILEFSFFETVQWNENMPFFEVCKKILPPTEIEYYDSSIKKVLKYHLSAAQNQLNTVKKWKDLWPATDSNTSQIDSDKIHVEAVISAKNANESGHDVNNEDRFTSKFYEGSQEMSDDAMNVSHFLSQVDSEESKEDNNKGNPTEPDEVRKETKHDSRSTEKNIITDSNPKESIDDKKSWIKSENNYSNPSTNVRDDFLVKQNDTETTSHMRIQNDTDLFLSSPSDSSIIMLKETDLVNSTNNSEEGSDGPLSKYFEPQDAPLSSEKEFPEQNTESNEIAPDLSNALENIDKEIHPLDKSEGQSDADESKGLNEFDEILEPKPPLASNNNNSLNKAVIQPLKIPLDMPTPAKVKLQDVFMENEKVYQDLSDALRHLTSHEHHDEQSEEMEDDLLDPIINSTEEKTYEKRSIVGDYIPKLSCDALKTVGIQAHLLMSQEMIEDMPNEELFNCVDLFASMKLSKNTKQLIWNRLDKSDPQLKGNLVSDIAVEDVRSFNFNVSHPWALETIQTFSKYNKDQSVVRYILDEGFNNSKELSIEEVISLGKLICNFSNLSVRLKPSIFLWSSVILSSVLPCEYKCLNTLAHIATQNKAYGSTLQWTPYDVADLGIIVAGLDIEEWKELVALNPDVLYGLQAKAGECLQTPFIEAIPTNHIENMPYFTRIAIYEKLKSENGPDILLEMFEPHDEISLINSTTTESSSSPLQTYSTFSIILIVLNTLYYLIFNRE